jgi:predicted DsbA family dithiol-disulfide isomerase
LDTASYDQHDVAPLKVEMWGDLQCVWCYIELAAFRKAAAELGGVDVRFRTYSLFPDRAGHLADGPREGETGWFPAGIASLTSELGLGYDGTKLASTGSQKAHELVHFAAACGEPLPMVQRLFRAHFAEGQDIGDLGTLVELAVECGLDKDGAATALRRGMYSAAVEQDNHLAYLLGVSGVPFAVINAKYTLSGIQTAGTVKNALVLARNAHGARL